MASSKQPTILAMNSKSVLLSFFLILFASFLGISQEVFKNNDLTITKLEKNMWVVETTDKTTMYIIEGTKKAMLIDTGTKCEKLDEVVRQITQKPLYVVITHIHVDHAGNMDFFDNVYFHPADTVLMSRVKPYKRKVHYVKNGDLFDLGGTTIEVLEAPGHTPGSIVLLDRKAGNCREMEALMDKGITKIYCGHYPYVKKAYDKSYISEMRQLAEELSKGSAPEGKPYPTKVSIGTQTPMITTKGNASIVYDPEKIN